MNYFYEEPGDESVNDALNPDVGSVGNSGNDSPGQGVAENVKKQTSEQVKKKVKEKVKKEAVKGAAKHSLMAAMSTVLMYVALAIIILFVIIGLIMFFVTMPGMVMEKLKALFEEAGKFIAAYFGADTTQMIKNEEVYETLDYLEQMGWELKSEGFLTGYMESESDAPEGTDTSNGVNVDEKVGVLRDDDDKIIAAKADFVFTYMVSDNYVYTIKNGNLATQSKGDNWFVSFLKGVGTAIYKAYNAVYGPVFDFLGINEAAGDTWGSGLLAFYYDNGVGIKGTYMNTESLWNWDDFEIDVPAKKLLIKRNELFNNNNAMEFSLDGWTGRYGMPLEFLLSVHKATMMPDLAYDMATTFNTNVNIYLHDVSGQAIAAYKTDSGDYITYPELNNALTGVEGQNIFSAVWSWFDNLIQTDKEVRIASALGVDHAENCTCVKDYVEGYKIAGTSIVAYKREDGTYYRKVEKADGTVEEVDIDTSTNTIETTTELQYTDICSACKDYLSEVISVARSNNDYNFKAYSPYIANVTDHWYRDVHFVVNNSDKKDFVDYDYEYEAIMKERWTLYETYTKEENPERAGEYKLYRVNDDGSLGDLYDGSQQDANDEGVAVIKKAVTFKSDETDRLADLGWNKNSSSVWSAYEASSGSETGYERIYEDDEIEGTGTEADVKRRLYINLKTTGNIVQTGEGQRTETNNTIKKMFLKNTYFRYDGSEEVAEIITQLRDENNIKYGRLKEDDLNKTTTYDGKVYTVKDLSGTVSLNQDSLNAFSMLENIHTLDSDYIYRDFKELIVELGYFTKEELTDETPRLLQFPVPEIGSAGYPKRVIDKTENEFGTAIHSRGDIEANEKSTMKALIEAMGEEVEYGTDDIKEITDNPTDLLKDTAPEDLGFGTMTAGIDISEVGAITKRKRPSQVSLNEFLKTTEEMCNKINEVGYDYCVYRPSGKGDNCTCTQTCIDNFEINQKCLSKIDKSCPCEENHCKHTIHQNPCHLDATFEDSQRKQEYYNFCCNFLVRWALINVGVYTTSDPYAISSMATFLQEELDGEMIEPGEALKPGDICFYRDFAHVDIVAESTGSSSFYKFNGGHEVAVGSQKGDGKSSINTFDGWADSDAPDFAVRLNWGNQNDGVYQGYNGNEAVVSPVTGILLEYGTYETEIDSTTGEEYRVNVDIKYGRDKIKTIDPEAEPEPTEPEDAEPVIDKVGYAKILVLDAEHYQKLESTMQNSWKNDSLVTIRENQNASTTELETENVQFVDYRDLDDFNMDTMEDWNAKDLTVYGYKEFAESYEIGGIAGYVVYIDGFVAETPDPNITFDEENGDDPEEVWEEKPNGTALTLSSFKVNENSLEDYPENAPQSMYEVDVTYKVASQKATEKIEAEAAVKEMASPAVTINHNSEEYIFIKEGTVLGRTMTDRELIEEIRVDSKENYEYYRVEEPENPDEDDEENMDRVMGNYVRCILRDLDGTVVEDIENYMKLDEKATLYPPQPYVAQPGDLQILANLIHHEGCEGYFTSLLNGDQERGQAASRVTGYVCINRALVNYGNYGTTIVDQIAAPGQYSTKDVVLNGPDVTCEYCLANAEWCLTYDCMSVTNPSGEEMQRNILGQSGWCQGCSPKYSCWWWVDSTGDGSPTEYTGPGAGFDTFFCANNSY